MLRIMYIRNQTLIPAPITVETIKVGQANKPDALTEFTKVLYAGTTKDPQSVQTERLIDSVTDDIMCAGIYIGCRVIMASRATI